MKRHLISLILTVVLVVGGVNVIPAGTKDVSAATQLNDFESYYSRDLGQTENLLGTVSKEEKWNIDENGVITDMNSTWWNVGDNLWPDMSVLKYNISQYKDFTLTVDFKNHIRGDYEEDGVTKKDNWEMRYGAFVGFGIKNNGGDITGWNGDNTGIIIKPYGTNSIKLAGSFDDINSGTHQSATQYETTIDGVNIANEDWHTMKLEVKAGIIKITVDEQQAWPTQPLGYSDWYEGGYVVIGSNNGGTQFKNIKIAGDKVVLTSQEERLKEYSAYYASDLGKTGNVLTSVNKTEKWYVDDDGVITDMNSTWWNDGNDLWKDMSMLAYNVQKYKEFSFSVDFKNNIRGDYEEDGITHKDNWEVRQGAMIGFGAQVVDEDVLGWNGEDTGVWIKPYGTNSIKLAGSFDDINSGTHQSATQWDTTIDGVDVSNDNWHNMKLEVKDGRIKIYVDNCLAWPEQPLSVGDDYNGGYLFLASNNGGTQFKNVQIEEYNSEEGEPTNDFSKVSSYYTEDNATSDLRLAEPTDYWTETNGSYKRKAVEDNPEAKDALYMAQLFLKDKQYYEFELEADINIGKNNWRRTIIGFGAQEGRHFRQSGGGMGIYFDGIDSPTEASVCHVGNCFNDDGVFKNWDTWGDQHYKGIDANGTVHVKMIVKDRAVTIYVDDKETPTKFSIPYWYKGGYIYLASNATGAKFSNITIKEISGTISEDTESPLYKKSSLFIGDSISYGAGADLVNPVGYSWGGIIGEKNEMDWLNVSVGGATIAESPATIIENELNAPCVESKDWDYIIVEGGINDAMKNIETGVCPLGTITPSLNNKFDKTTFAGALEALFKRLIVTYPNAKIGYIVTFNIKWEPAYDSDKYFDLAKQICDKWGIQYLNLRDNSILDNESFMENLLMDGCHPSTQGYETLSPIIEGWMKTLKTDKIDIPKDPDETTKEPVTQETTTNKTDTPGTTTQRQVTQETTTNKTDTPGTTTQRQVTVQKPAKAVIKKLKNTKKKSIKISLKKAVRAKKYQIQYSLNKKFKKAKIKTTTKLTYVIKNLKKGKTYYVRVRGVNGTKNGAWSRIKRVKIKK